MPAAISAPKSGGQLFLAGKPAFLETVIIDDPATRAELANWLHAVLCELVPGGFAKKITAAQATAVLAELPPRGEVDTARRGRHGLGSGIGPAPRADRTRNACIISHAYDKVPPRMAGRLALAASERQDQR